jgi:hypothetical protein
LDREARLTTLDSPPVVTVLHNTPYGVMVRWFRDLDGARNQQAQLTATIAGVFVGIPSTSSWISLTDIPDSWLAAARAAHETLKAGGDVSGLATHQSRFPGGGGPLDPVTPDED